MTIPKRTLKKILHACRRSGTHQSRFRHDPAVLFAFPMNKQHQAIAYRVFATILKNAGIKTCCLIPEQDREILADLTGTQVIGLTIPDDILKQPLLDELTKQLLQPYHFTVALDLNPEFHPYPAAAVLCSQAPVRIGFMTEYSDHFFNIQISKKETDPIESSYRYMENLVMDSGLNK